MTAAADQEREKEIYKDVADIISERDPECLHYPTARCRAGHCTGCKGRYDWDGLAVLIAAFLNAGGDVDDRWKERARQAGFEFEPDSLHDILLGIFVGGDHPDRVGVANF